MEYLDRVPSRVIPLDEAIIKAQELLKNEATYAFVSHSKVIRTLLSAVKYAQDGGDLAWFNAMAVGKEQQKIVDAKLDAVRALEQKQESDNIEFDNIEGFV